MIVGTIFRPGDFENRASPRYFVAEVATQHDVILANGLLATLSDKYRYKESKTLRVQFTKDLAATEIICLYKAMLTMDHSRMAKIFSDKVANTSSSTILKV